MAKGKYRKNQQQEEEDFGKKKKNMITQQLLMDKSNMDFTQFIPLLPQDIFHPPTLTNIPSPKPLLKILTDLNYLLYLQPKSFWATVTYNISFQHCLSSCLSQLSCRWMNVYMYETAQENEEDCDFPYRMVKDSEAYDYMEGLHEVLLKLVFRIMQFSEEDQRLNEIYNFGENTVKKLNVFNMIKLMELIEIYSSREQNKGVLKAITRNFLHTLSNPYKTFVDQYLPHILKKLEQYNRDVKLVSDREQFGINYSYTRMNKKTLSPGEQQLKRKVCILMGYLSVMRFFKNSTFLTEQIVDHLYFNSQINFVLENAFYELDAAYKIWSFQGVEKRLLPMMNQIFVELIDYFVEYFKRVNEKVVKKTSKQNVDAYARSLERFFVDYGKRYSLGKKGASIRQMTLFKLVMKRVNLVQMLQELYVFEEETKLYEFNMEYFIDFKLALEDSFKEDNYINEQDQRQEEIQEETQVPNDIDMKDVDQDGDNGEQNDKENKQQAIEGDVQDANKLKYFTPQSQDKLQFLVSKKSRQDDYYQQLYLKQRQRCKIEYQDEYDDLVDYDKRPLFMDSASSDSDSEDEVRLQRLVSNENNQKANQIKHIKFQEKQKEKKNQPKYTKVTKQERSKLTGQQQYERQEMNEKQQTKPKYVSKPNSSQKQQKPKFVAKTTDKQPQGNKQRGNKLSQLIEAQQMPQQGQQGQEEGSTQRGGYKSGRGGQGSHKRRYVPVKAHDNKGYKQKGGNSNKNKEYGNETNQSYGGGKKYKAKY